jgi:hypothetical protein
VPNEQIPVQILNALIIEGYVGHRSLARVLIDILRVRSGSQGGITMVPRQVLIDWADLEMAFTWQTDEWAYYLDVRTGKVRVVSTSSFDMDDDALSDDEEPLSEEAIDAGLAQGWLLQIEPVESSEEYQWMTEFAASIDDPQLRDLLEVALDGRGAFRRFKDVLASWPQERERWFAFHDERLRDAMQEWLGAHEIESTTAPPRRAS